MASWLACMWSFLVFLSLSHVVSWVRCGIWLYRFLIFALLLTLYTIIFLKQHYPSHNIRYINSLAISAMPYNSKPFFCYCKIIRNLIKLLIILTCQYNLLIVSKWLAIWCYQHRSNCYYFYMHFFPLNTLNTVLKLKRSLYEFILLVGYLLQFNCHLSKIPTTHSD